MPSDLRTVWEFLHLESDERFVISAVYRKSAGRPVFAAATLIAGPPAIGETGWPGWRLAEGFQPPPRAEDVAVPASFVHELDEAIGGRVVLSQDEAYKWLRAALAQGVAPAAGGLPEAASHLGSAAAPIRVTTQSETSAGGLAAWFPRPVIGFHFPSEDASDGVPDPVDRWEISGTTHFSPALELLGIGWFENRIGDQPSGLLLGRFERTAWLLKQELDSERDLYAITLAMDPERIDLADLEITVEERAAGELIFAEHVRLEDTELTGLMAELLAPPPTRGRRVISVGLPTLGRGIRRSVALFHRDHGLLDAWEPFNLVETIPVSMDVGGGPQPLMVIGEKRSPQDVAALLGAVERVRLQYAELRKEGTKNRVFDTLAAGRPILREMLERARGEVLVVDPWFRDWSLLDDAGDQPPRVLLGGGASSPPSSFTGRARRWHENTAPFHDRFFLWDGGGISVGTSASTFGDRLFRIARLGSAESEVLRTQFSLWWDDPGFRPA